MQINQQKKYTRGEIREDTTINDKRQCEQIAKIIGTSTLPHYHIKKCVEKLQMSKKSITFAAIL